MKNRSHIALLAMVDQQMEMLKILIHAANFIHHKDLWKDFEKYLKGKLMVDNG